LRWGQPSVGMRFRALCRATMPVPLSMTCGLPLDPEGTLDRVDGGTLRVGVIPHARSRRGLGDEGRQDRGLRSTGVEPGAPGGPG
jgi:hypothetical protein